MITLNQRRILVRPRRRLPWRRILCFPARHWPLRGILLRRRALSALRALARRCADGEKWTFEQDWGLGSVTLGYGGKLTMIEDAAGKREEYRGKEAHTHVGGDHGDDDAVNLEAFVVGLDNMLTHRRGLSFVSGEDS